MNMLTSLHVPTAWNNAPSVITTYRVGHEKVARLPFAFAFGYCINFHIYAMQQTRATISWPTLYMRTQHVNMYHNFWPWSYNESNVHHREWWLPTHTATAMHDSNQSTKAKYAGNMGIIHKFPVSEIKPQSLTLLHIQSSRLSGIVCFLSAFSKPLFQFVTKLKYVLRSCYASSHCIITFYFLWRLFKYDSQSSAWNYN
jgi:hypothetical protein